MKEPNGQTITEKILARVSHRERVRPGDVLYVEPDCATSSDFRTYPLIANTLDEIGITQIANPDKVVITVDHCFPAPTTAWANKHRGLKEWVEHQKIKYFYNGEGINAQILAENGHALPGNFLTANDFNTNLGGLGCFSYNNGTPNIISVYASGKAWLIVPSTIKVELEGDLSLGVVPRDIVTTIMHDLQQNGKRAVIELTGSAVTKMDIDERMSLCCERWVYSGAKTAIINPDEKVMEYVKNRAKGEMHPVTSDSDAKFQSVMRYDVSKMVPVVARPGDLRDSIPVSEIKGLKVDVVFIGSCSGGRIHEMRHVAKILKGHHVHPRVLFMVIPPSRQIMLQMEKEGIMDILLQSGAHLGQPSCGLCGGNNYGNLADGEVCVTCSTNNLNGRMGSSTAKIYAGSPLTAAAAALKGELVDPREFL